MIRVFNEVRHVFDFETSVQSFKNRLRIEWLSWKYLFKTNVRLENIHTNHCYPLNEKYTIKQLNNNES